MSQCRMGEICAKPLTHNQDKMLTCFTYKKKYSALLYWPCAANLTCPNVAKGKGKRNELVKYCLLFSLFFSSFFSFWSRSDKEKTVEGLTSAHRILPLARRMNALTFLIMNVICKKKGGGSYYLRDESGLIYAQVIEFLLLFAASESQEHPRRPVRNDGLTPLLVGVRETQLGLENEQPDSCTCCT